MINVYANSSLRILWHFVNQGASKYVCSDRKPYPERRGAGSVLTLDAFLMQPQLLMRI
jgi:hypothetical protein